MLALAVMACDQKKPPAPPPPPPPAPPLAPIKPVAGTPCDLSKKPPRPPMPDVSTPALCAALGGKWVTKGTTGPSPATSTTGLECRSLGQGRDECTRRVDGCEGFAWATTDAARVCIYDWDCQASCEEGHCAAMVLRIVDGCRARCVNGAAQVVCED